MEKSRTASGWGKMRWAKWVKTKPRNKTRRIHPTANVEKKNRTHLSRVVDVVRFQYIVASDHLPVKKNHDLWSPYRVFELHTKYRQERLRLSVARYIVVSFTPKRRCTLTVHLTIWSQHTILQSVISIGFCQMTTKNHLQFGFGSLLLVKANGFKLNQQIFQQYKC